MADFNFIDAYRDMQPTAPREVVAAREAAYLSIMKEAPKTTVRLAELARVYFGLAVQDEDGFDAWFGKAIRQKDKFISLQKDKEEVARIASVDAPSDASGFLRVARSRMLSSVRPR